MADLNTSKVAAKKDFVIHELLSPSELFDARGTRSHKMPVRGQKDFEASGSEQQKRRLEQSLENHWRVLAEERVERLGNLVKAVWIPEEKLVELQSPAAKFWQTMGFSERGKQFLHPEEALHLMECGSVQVFYRDLPLSIQEGYEHFLSSDTLTLHQYQVFGHLKRLGYVVNRFDSSSVPFPASASDKSSGDRQRKQQKRKRSESPEASNKQKHSTSQQVPDEIQSSAHLESSTASPTSRLWWTENPSEPRSALNQPCTPRWDFSRLCFPDVGSFRGDRTPLGPPDSSLLPGGLKVGECNLSRWLDRLNMRQERFSRKERDQQRQRDREGYRRSINRDPEVQRCSSWAEFTQLMDERRRQHCSRRDGEHLWESKPTPLSRPGQTQSHRQLLDQIDIIKSSSLSEGVSRLSSSEQWKIVFNVYQPDTVAEFKKSHPGNPYTRMCVCSFSAPVPDLQTLKLLSFQSGDVPVTFAVVDHGDISFYCFKEFQLPTDVY